MKSLQYTFTSGEITPEAHGRVDLDAIQHGLALCKNFTVLSHGPAARRPGKAYVGHCGDSSLPVRLFPFIGSEGGSATTVFDTNTAVLVEMGHRYVRFYANGARVHDAATPTTITTISGGDTFSGPIPVGWADGDWVTLAGTEEAGLTPLLDQTYELTDVVAGVSFKLKHTPVDIPVDASAAPASPAALTVARVYTVTSPYTADTLDKLRFTQSPTFITFTHPDYQFYELRRTGDTTWAFSGPQFSPTILPPAGLAAVSTPASPPSTAIDHTYVITSVAADLVTESAASTPVTEANDLTLAGNINTLTWSAATDAVLYRIYKSKGGVFGLIGSTNLLTIVDANLLPDIAVTPPTLRTGFNTMGRQFAAAVAYVEQRRAFAGTYDNPDTVWMTRNGTDTNLTTSVPARSDDALSFKIAAQRNNAIRHLVPLNDLLALTAGGGFRISAEGGGALAFDTVAVKPQQLTGASEVSPVLTPTSAIYVQQQGSRVREISFDPNGQGRYQADDLSLLAPHLVQDFSIVDIAYTTAPEQVLWAVREDGVLLGMTHVPEHKVYAWHQHETDGYVESVTVLPEGANNVLYLVVRRETAGVGGKVVRYVEKLMPRIWSTPLQLDRAFFVDAGSSFYRTAVAVVDRLWHLEGLDVYALADGAPVGPFTVADGQITLDVPAAVVHVGLRYTSDMETIPFNSSRLEAFGGGKSKSVLGVDLLVKDTVGAQVGQSFDDLFRPDDALGLVPLTGDPSPLYTGLLRVPVGLGWENRGRVCLRQEDPLPCTVLSVLPDLELGD